MLLYCKDAMEKWLSMPCLQACLKQIITEFFGLFCVKPLQYNLNT